MGRRHGFSLLEVLVALSMLSVLTTLSVAWMHAAVSKQREALAISRWDRGANAVLDQIARDLMQIDVLSDGRSSGEPRVWVEDEHLCIRSPVQGSSRTIRYMHAVEQQSIVRQSPADRALAHPQPPMLGSVVGAEFALIVDEESRNVPELRVALRSADGRLVERSFLLEPGDASS
ncbi:MAG: type II secretion system protein J [Phycisphaerales bacterium]